eukprot:1160884-Pelagomonas_calceolata.AAC.22
MSNTSKVVFPDGCSCQRCAVAHQPLCRCSPWSFCRTVPDPDAGVVHGAFAGKGLSLILLVFALPPTHICLTHILPKFNSISAVNMPTLPGPSPVESMQLLQRLSLFPVVFALPPATQKALPADYALACVRCMATTHALVQAAGIQVRFTMDSCKSQAYRGEP